MQHSFRSPERTRDTFENRAQMGCEKRIQAIRYTNMIYDILGWGVESFVKLMHYYFHSNSQKPSCKEIMQVCENHAREITSEDTNIKVQVLS